MNKLIFLTFSIVLLNSCSHNNSPDVSNIDVDASIRRFDKDFFGVDTLHLKEGLDSVQKKYPWFFGDFIQNLVIDGKGDSSASLPVVIKQYIRNARSLYDSAEQKFPSLQEEERQLKNGFQFVKYYFPEYKLPKVVSYAGLIGDPSVALTREAMAIGLQMYLGKNFSAYNTLEAIDKFPNYISRRFERPFIPVNCIQNVALDIYPDKTQGLSLIEQLIEKGKQWFLTDKFLPATPDSLKTGYTQSQVLWCQSHEGLIWNFILQNNDLFTTDSNVIQNFIGEAPKTEAMGDASPGNIGQWVGWQIVKTFSEKNPGLTPLQIIQTDAKKIFEEAKYKPK